MFCGVNIDFGGVNFPSPYIKKDTIYIGFVSIFSGCNRALKGNPCPNCQNPSLWAHNQILPSSTVTIDKLESFIDNKMQRFLDLYATQNIQYYYTILGGEPLDQNVNELEEVESIIKGAIPNGNNIPVVLFSGYDSIKRISKEMKSYIKNHVTYLKLGRYLGNRHRKNDLPSGLSTENQQWYIVDEMKLAV